MWVWNTQKSLIFFFFSFFFFLLKVFLIRFSFDNVKKKNIVVGDMYSTFLQIQLQIRI